MLKISKSISYSEQFGLLIGKISLLAMMAVITISSVGRYLFQAPIPGLITFVEIFLLVAVVFLSASWVQREGGNVNVTVFVDRLPTPYIRLIRALTLLGLLAVLLPIWYHFADTALGRWGTRATTSGWPSFPTYISWGLATLGISLLIFRLIDQIYSNLPISAIRKPITNIR